ncbi:DNA helicase MCM9-like [Anopheles ziemanni]|uniref:DNA helicase MCM9-like n=1 Tax=Anopheles ziemanni TaxID=345580 RepID=UPI0026602363|nr:DNA helicase MCM9-like [Anopheles ziemanni]
MEAYLKQYHDQEITDLLNNPDDLLHVSIHVNLAHLNRKQSELYRRIIQNTDVEVTRWNECLLRAQKSLIEGNLFLEPGFQIKQNCHVRFVNMPLTPSELRRAAYPSNDNVGQFLQVKGSVIRMTSSRFLEYKREYSCTRCKRTVLHEAEYSKSYVFDPPGPCPSARETGCRGQLQPVSVQPLPEHCRDYQEIRIQEIMSERNVPASLVVTLEDDLVDICQPGDCVTVCGRIEHRWKPPSVGRRTEITITMRANSVTKEESKASWAKDLPEHLLCVQAEWQEVLREIGELAARDLLVQSIAPAIRGMYPVKLAIALALASCSERPGDAEQQTVRGHSHLLLVGDPGLAKSQLLKFASEIASRAVYTTGMGCSSAGLTAAAVKDEGEWQLEAGALVLADGGICCIDEFNLMRETDKASIHEAMEQQTISVAKAGMVCKLSTRCVVLAATNPKNLYTMSDGEGTSAANIGIGGPLLSRFDIVLILKDIRAADWDADIASHLLSLALRDEEKQTFGEDLPGWNGMEQFATWELEKLQLHFAAIKDIHPRVSTEANLILGAYYKACRSDPFRDPARTTVRLLDSLFRLSQAHARLLFRSEVTPVDAITVIQLMEASWGFGKIGITQYDLIKAELPLGPDQTIIDRLMDILNLHNLVQESVTVRPIDANILRRYHREMVAKKKIQQADKNERKDAEALSGNQGLSQPTVTLCSPRESRPGVTQNDVVSIEDPVPAPSKYSFRPKANLKKLRKAPLVESSCTDRVELEEGARIPKKRKRQAANEVEEDYSLKAPLDETALGNLLGSLRRDFVNLGQSEPNDTLVASGKSSHSQDKDISFSMLLDTSRIFDDEGDEDFENELNGTNRQPSQIPAALGPAYSLLTKPIAIDVLNARNGREIETQDHQNHLPDTIPNTIPNTVDSNDDDKHSPERSIYKIQRPSQKKITMLSSVQQHAARNCALDDDDDLLNFEIEPSGDCPLLNSTEPNSSTPYEPGIRTQAREKLLRFEFQPRRNEGQSVQDEDDSAYDSMLRNGVGQIADKQRAGKQTGSQYSGLLNGDEPDDSEIDFHLSDID